MATIIETSRAHRQLQLRLARDTAEDAQRFCALSNSLYARKVTPDYYRWQFFGTPFPSLLMFALGADEALVACYGVQLKPASLDLPAAMALDIMVAAEHQGQGIFRTVAQAALAAAQAYRPAVEWVFANPRAHRAHVRQLGWNSLGRFRDYVAPTAGSRLGSRLEAIEISALGEEDCRLLDAMDARRRRWEGLAFSRSASFLEWRVLRNPRYRYRLLRCQEARQTVGYLVLKTFCDPTTGASTGDVIDVLPVQSDQRLAVRLMRTALAAFAEQGIAEATTWLATGGAVDTAAQELGFLPSERVRWLSCRACDPRQGALVSRDRWSVSMLDTDLY